MEKELMEENLWQEQIDEMAKADSLYWWMAVLPKKLWPDENDTFWTYIPGLIMFVIVLFTAVCYNAHK